MANLVGGAGWVLVWGGALSWRWVSLSPTKPSTPISRTARMAPIKIRRPRGLRRNRLDEEAFPPTFTRVCGNVAPGVRAPTRVPAPKLVISTNISRMARFRSNR